MVDLMSSTAGGQAAFSTGTQLSPAGDDGALGILVGVVAVVLLVAVDLVRSFKPERALARGRIPDPALRDLPLMVLAPALDLVASFGLILVHVLRHGVGF